MPTYLSPGVYVEEAEAGTRPIEGVGTAVAAFVGFAERGPVNEPTMVTNWDQFTGTFGDFVTGSYLAHSVYGYFLNGGGACYVVRVGGDGSSGSQGQAKELSTAAQAQVGPFRIRALDSGASAPRISVEVADTQAENPPQDAFRLVISVAGSEPEVYDPVVAGRGRQNLMTVVNDRSQTVRVEEVQARGQAERPANTSATLEVPPPAPPVPVTPVSINADEYVGNAADRTGFSGLEAVDEVTMLCVPDLMSAYQQGLIDIEMVQAVQLQMIAHCELMGDRMAILDPPPNLSPQQVKEWRVDKAGYDSRFATLYYPWIKVFDPASGTNEFVPPSGYMAGVWSRTDNTRGVHKAPANEIVRGVVALETNLTKPEHDALNPIGVNAIRAFPGRGIRVWGARTLSSDPAWRYVNVRRLFNYLEESILLGTQWVVFEPNDDALWARIRRTISAFLVNEWRKGALFGLTQDEAFFVKCDRETNPAEAIDAGQVTCLIGIAPVKPAEFVIFRLSQFSGGTSLVSE
jgi:uncharacterized protein